ncbi:LysR family transcriptional regulator [Streptomyces sp. NPDC002742]|uniref:LysR family transcriptional regulator n=1 Tax=Streptomyces sp. NPDC002742 TaxID=3364663 RepID=UPI0036C10B53
MLLRQLEYLVALARERHFARAAAACFVSQPSLSAAIRRLEHELDVPIVRRGRRYEGLTPEGEVVLAWAHRILAERDALRQELSALRGGLTGTLRLGIVPTALPAASLLTTPFCERHAQLPGGRWSSVISHAWLHMFGVPRGMRVVPLEGPAHGPWVGIVVARHEPESVLAQALLKVAGEAGVRDALDALLKAHLGETG